MDRDIIYQITPAYDGMKIQHYLRRRGYSRQNMIELKKEEGCVQVNGAARHFNERLHAGDTLLVRIREREISRVRPVPVPIPIIYEDEDILVVNKPAGMPVHPSFRNTDNTLANALAWYFQCRDVPFVFRCSNRLDRDTSGLTVVSKHHVSAAILSEMGTRHEIRREYLALVRGMVRPAQGSIDAPLGRKDTSIIERCVDYEKGEPAQTHYKVLRYYPAPHGQEEASAPDRQSGFTLLSLLLETGRTHQIRVHMQSIGHPLLGDYLYNPNYREGISSRLTRQALHAWRLTFNHPVTGERMDFEAPVPADLLALLETAPAPLASAPAWLHP